jgi:hypothetical protein
MQPHDATHAAAVPGSARPRLSFRRRILVILALSFALLAGAGAWLAAPRALPSVRTLVRVPAGPHFHFRGEPAPDIGNHQRTQAALAKSRLVLNSALRDPEVANLPLIASKVDPVEWLEKEVQVDFSIAPEIMRIRMGGAETDQLEALVNAIRRAYLLEVVDKEFATRRERMAYLGELIQKYEDRLKTAREMQRDIQDQLGDNAEARTRVVAMLERQGDMLQGELLSTRSQLRKARIELALLQEQEKAAGTEASGQDGADAQDRASERRQARAEARRLQARIMLLERTAEVLGPEVESVSQRLREMGKKRARLDAFREDVSHIEDMAKRFRHEHEALRVELQAPRRVAVIEEATVSRGKPELHDWAPAGGAALAACCFALLGLVAALRGGRSGARPPVADAPGSPRPPS